MASTKIFGMWEVCDGGEGKHYYFNTVTSGSTWVRPDNLIPPSAMEAERNHRDNWEVRTNDDGDGAVYFVNFITGETTWEKPQCLFSKDGATDWEECTDKAGKKFFYNAKTGVTQWDRPATLRKKLSLMSRLGMFSTKREGKRRMSAPFQDWEEVADGRGSKYVGRGVGTNGKARRGEPPVHPGVLWPLATCRVL